MLSNFAVSVYFGIGLGGWAYAQAQRRNGGNVKESLIVAVGTGLLGLIALYVILGFFDGGESTRSFI